MFFIKYKYDRFMVLGVLDYSKWFFVGLDWLVWVVLDHFGVLDKVLIGYVWF